VLQHVKTCGNTPCSKVVSKLAAVDLQLQQQLLWDFVLPMVCQHSKHVELAMFGEATFM